MFFYSRQKIIIASQSFNQKQSVNPSDCGAGLVLHNLSNRDYDYGCHDYIIQSRDYKNK